MKSLLSALITVGTVYLVYLYVDLRELLKIVANAQPAWISVACLVFGLNYILRTLRFSLMLRVPGSGFLSLFGATALYGMYNYLLPAKSGEATFPVLARRHAGQTIAVGSASLVMARLYDFLSLSLYLPLILIGFWDTLPDQIRLPIVLFCALFYVSAAIVFGLLSPRVYDRLPKFAKRVLYRARHTPGVTAFFDALISIHSERKQRQLFVLTLLIWLCVYTNFYAIVRALGYDASFFQLIVVSAILLPLTLIPVQGVANLGSHELAWVTAFTLYGYSQDDTLAIAVGSHAILLALVLALGLVGYLLTLRRPPPS
jgi:uncharacterized protein (TIRG00374 family)